MRMARSWPVPLAFIACLLPCRYAHLGRGDFGEHVGGIGVYDRTSAHGPFVHVDTRGMIVRW